MAMVLQEILTIDMDNSGVGADGTVQFVNTVGANNDLDVIDITGNLNLDAAISNTTSLSVSGTSNLGADVTTSSTQTYSGAVTLSTDVTLTTTDSNITFSSTIDSDSTARDLTLTLGSGSASVTGIVGTTSLDVLTLNSSASFTAAVTATSIVNAANKTATFSDDLTAAVTNSGGLLFNHTGSGATIDITYTGGGADIIRVEDSQDNVSPAVVTFSNAITATALRVGALDGSKGGSALFAEAVTIPTITVIGGNHADEDSTIIFNKAVTSSSGISLNDNTGSAYIIFAENNSVNITGIINGASAGEGTIQVTGATKTFVNIIGGTQALTLINIDNTSVFNEAISVTNINIADSVTATAKKAITATAIVLDGGTLEVSTTNSATIAGTINGNDTTEGVLHVSGANKTFSGDIGTSQVLTEIDIDGATVFNGTIKTTTLDTASAEYDLEINGAANEITNAVTFNNTGALTLGNGSGDTTTFTGGVTATAPSQVNLAGTIQTTNNTMSLGDAGTPIVLTANTILSGNTAGAITLGGTVNGGYSLTLNTTGTNTLSGEIGGSTALTTLTTNTGGTTVISVDIETSSTQTYNDAVTISSDVTLTTTNSNVSFGGTTDAGTAGDTLTIAAGSGDVTFTDAVGGSTAMGNLTITTGAISAAAIKVQGTIDITNTDTSSVTGIISDGATSSILTKAGSGKLTLSGNNTYTGAVTVNAGRLHITHANGLGTTDAATTVTDGARLNINGGLTIAEAITINGTGDSSKGALHFNGGNNTISGNITLGADAKIHSHTGTQTISGTINGAHSLTITGTDDFTISGIVGGSATLDSITATITSSGTFTVGANITTSGNQMYTAAGGIVTSGARTFTSNSGIVNFVSALSGDNNVTVTGILDLDGAATGLSTLEVSSTSNLGANVTTSSTQTYTGAVVLSTDVTLTTTDSNITFGSTVDGDGTARDLTIDMDNSGEGADGTVQFANTVGANNSLDAIAITGNLNLDAAISNTTSLSVSGTSNLGANVATSSTQTYTGDVTISADISLNTSGGDVTFDGDINTNTTSSSESGILQFLGGGSYKYSTDSGSTYSTGTATSSATTLGTGSLTYSAGSYTWTTPDGASATKLLVVGGGGGGGHDGAGGGGAGGLIYNANYSISANTSYSVTVGNGGNKATSVGTRASNGSNSVFNDQTAIGGGGGGSKQSSGAAGGSGGGGGHHSSNTYLGGNGTSGQGNAGGRNSSQSGGGGGGAGGAGANANGSNGGNGGAGLSYDITGSSQYYAAGGAGGTYVGNGGTGGSSIGGDGCGGSGCSSVDTSATANTGSGGGSNGNLGAGGSSGNGASGIVVVNYSYSGSSNAEHNLTISTGSGAVDINGAVANIGTLSITSNSTSSEASGIISTDTIITKAGSGTLLLSANNTYTGQTNINAGIISITDNNSLGSADGATIVADGASLSISNDITSAENITISGTGISSNGAIRNTADDNTLTGLITLGAHSEIQIDTGSSLTLNPTSGSAVTGTYNLTIDSVGTSTISDPIAISTGNYY